MSALNELQKLLRAVPNLAEVSRECGVPRRTLERIRDGISDTSLTLGERIYAAAVKHSPPAAADPAGAA